MKIMKKLHLASGETFEGKSFGADTETFGEVVFATGMAGYLETLTDPSYYGQIVVFTFPLIGNYGVFESSNFEFRTLPTSTQVSNENKKENPETIENIDSTYESSKIWVKGVVLSEVSEEFSHCRAFQNFSDWLKENNIPAICGVDTREITQILRERGCILGSISEKNPEKFEDLLKGRYVPEVSPKEVSILEPNTNAPKTIAFMDCGAKNGIFRNFLKRGIRIIRFPFNVDPFKWLEEQKKLLSTLCALPPKFDGIFFSNGPGDPAMCFETIEICKKVIKKDIPIFGICLGNQILALAAGGKTRKMKYGHRGVNQPVCEVSKDERRRTNNKENFEKLLSDPYPLPPAKCLITSQNHGYEVDESVLPNDFEVWFKNLNDGSVEGIRHTKKPIFSVQFHPEACAGPEDAEYLFDVFLEKMLGEDAERL